MEKRNQTNEGLVQKVIDRFSILLKNKFSKRSVIPHFDTELTKRLDNLLREYNVNHSIKSKTFV